MLVCFRRRVARRQLKQEFGVRRPAVARPASVPSGHGPPVSARRRASSSAAMAASVVLPVRWISAITARVVALALVACSDRAVRARAAVSALPPDGRLRHPSFGSSGSGSWSRSRHLAFDFTRHFFQPHRIGRAGDQGAQLGGNRRSGWLSFAVSLQLGPSAAAQGMGGHVSPSCHHGMPCLDGIPCL